MIHIVFQQQDVEVLQKAIEMDDALQGPVLQIKDDYAVGNIDGLDKEDGWGERKQWWKTLLEASPYGDTTNMVDDRLTVHQLIRELDKNDKEVVWIWMGQNAHDVCGYYWLISSLKNYQGRIFVLYLNNLPFINEKGNIFFPTALHEIQPKEFLKAKKLNRAVTLSEFEVDPDEWKRLCDEDAMIRILEGGKKIGSQKADYYDNDILTNLVTEWQKGNRAMANILGKMKIKTGDVFLLWRMKELAVNEMVEINGDPSKGWKEFEVRLKTPHSVEVLQADNN